MYEPSDDNVDDKIFTTASVFGIDITLPTMDHPCFDGEWGEDFVRAGKYKEIVWIMRSSLARALFLATGLIADGAAYPDILTELGSVVRTNTGYEVASELGIMLSEDIVAAQEENIVRILVTLDRNRPSQFFLMADALVYPHIFPDNTADLVSGLIVQGIDMALVANASEKDIRTVLFGRLSVNLNPRVLAHIPSFRKLNIVEEIMHAIKRVRLICASSADNLDDINAKIVYRREALPGGYDTDATVPSHPMGDGEAAL